MVREASFDDGETWTEDGSVTIVLDANWTGAVVVGAQAIYAKPDDDGRPMFRCVDHRPFKAEAITVVTHGEIA